MGEHSTSTMFSKLGGGACMMSVKADGVGNTMFSKLRYTLNIKPSKPGCEASTTKEKLWHGASMTLEKPSSIESTVVLELVCLAIMM